MHSIEATTTSRELLGLSATLPARYRHAMLINCGGVSGVERAVCVKGQCVCLGEGGAGAELEAGSLTKRSLVTMEFAA